MKKSICCAAVALILGLSGIPVSAAEAVDPFLGYWALTTPEGRAGWLSVTQENGYLDASILWGGGSVVLVANGFGTFDINSSDPIAGVLSSMPTNTSPTWLA